jgi:orotate phosphoribosyltransferase
MVTIKSQNSKIERLKKIIKKKAIRRKLPGQEPFRLASGDTSDVFFDCKLVTQDPEGISLIAEIIFDRVKDYCLDRIGGIQTGAIPICTAVAQFSYSKGQPIPAFWTRDKRKGHGTKKWIEGGLKSEERVVIVDDVTTRGNSVMEAVKAAKELDCEIVELITIVDRNKGAKEKFEKIGIKFTALFKMSDFDI